MANRVFISEALILKATHPRGASGGVGDWIQGFISETDRVATALAPIGNPLNRVGDGRPVGCFKQGFRHDMLGSNGTVARGVVYNVCEHARWAENGRDATYDQYERFSWSKGLRPGQVGGTYEGTGGYEGFHSLADAFAMVGRRRRFPVGISAGLRSPGFL